MIIHVIAAEIGETGGRQAHPVQAELVETVAGRLESGMGDLVPGQPRKFLVERHRVRRRQPAVDAAVRGHRSDGSEACGRMAGGLKDLTHEMGDGGLAAGPGHRHDGFRLIAVKGRRHQGECPPRLGTRQDDSTSGRIGPHLVGCLWRAKDRNRARIHRTGDKTRAVRACALQGSKQKTRLHRTAVGGQTGNIDSPRPFRQVQLAR